MITWIQFACWGFLWFVPKWKWVLCYAGIIFTLRICSVVLFAEMQLNFFNSFLSGSVYTKDILYSCVQQIWFGVFELIFLSVVVFCRQKHLKHKAYLKECEKKIIEAHAKKHGLKTED